MQPRCTKPLAYRIIGNYLEVVRAMFSYISLLKTSISSFPPYFEEFRELSEISFRNREKSQPHTYVISLTARLEEDRPAEWLLSADSLYREYNEGAVKAVLDCLLPEKARFTLSAKDHEALLESGQITWQKERWYGTEYAVQRFGSDILEKVCFHAITAISDSSFEYSAVGHPRVTPTTPKSIYTKEPRSDPGWRFHGKLYIPRACTMLLERCLDLDSNAPGLYFRDEFAASLVQTGQYVLGSEGPCVPRLEIVGHKYGTGHVH
jgi:hypothetical protein